MTPCFGLMMFWVPRMTMKPLWMSAMRRPRMPETMLVVSMRVAVTLIALNSVMINRNSVMINLILNFLMSWWMKQWRFPGMYLLMMFLLMMKPLRRRWRGTTKLKGCSTEGKEHVIVLVKWSVVPPPVFAKAEHKNTATELGTAVSQCHQDQAYQ